MLRRDTPAELVLDATLDDSPRYRGSIHDQAVAIRMGYRGALIPGAFVYGYMSRMAIATWGIAWAGRGTIEARFRRPVYHGDRLTLAATALAEAEGGLRSSIAVLNQNGEEVATGALGLNDAAPPIDPGAFPLIPVPAEPSPVAPGDIAPGTRLGTRDAVLTEADFRQSLADFGETDPLYLAGPVVHSGCLMRLAMADAYANFRFPGPPILVAVRAVHLGIARPGDRLSVSGSVTAAFERKGQHYFDSDELLVANGVRPVARFLRTSIYAARPAA